MALAARCSTTSVSRVGAQPKHTPRATTLSRALPHRQQQQQQQDAAPSCSGSSNASTTTTLLASTTAAAVLLSAQSADAAQEVAQLAIDNRVALLGALFLPVLGWVGLNIIPGLLRQLSVMSEKKASSYLAPAAGLGAAATLLCAQSADAAQEVAQLAIDNRVALLGTLFLPVLGWVGLNIIPGLLRQLQVMADKKGE